VTAVASESVAGEFDDEFDLDIRIDDIDPGEPDRIHLASFAMSCSMCCPGESVTAAVCADSINDPCPSDACPTRGYTCVCTYNKYCN
jgi:hypothetical protein